MTHLENCFLNRIKYNIVIYKILFNENDFKCGFKTSKVGGGNQVQKGDIEGVR